MFSFQDLMSFGGFILLFISVVVSIIEYKRK